MQKDGKTSGTTTKGNLRIWRSTNNLLLCRFSNMRRNYSSSSVPQDHANINKYLSSEFPEPSSANSDGVQLSQFNRT